MPTVYYFTGFETDGFSGLAAESPEVYSGLSTLMTHDTSFVRTGARSLRAAYTGSAVGSYLMPKQIFDGRGFMNSTNWSGQIVSGFYFAWNVKPVSSHEPIMRIDQALGTTVAFLVCLNASGQIEVLNGKNGYALLGTSTTPLSGDTWYRIEFSANKTGAWELRIDGTTEASGTAVIDTGDLTALRLGKVQNRYSQDMTVYFDDFVLADGFMAGDWRVEQLLPTSNHTVGAGWTADYATVAQVPARTSGEAIGANAGEEFSVNLGGLALSAGDTVEAVKPVVAGSITSGTTSRAKLVLRSGATRNIASFSGAMGPTYVYSFSSSNSNSFQRIFQTDPDTSAAWTVGGVNGVSTGLESFDTTAGLKVSQITLQVLVNESPAVPVVEGDVAVDVLSSVPTASGHVVTHAEFGNTIDGVKRGFDGGDIGIIDNWYAGVDNGGEWSFTGTNFTRDGVEYSLGYLGNGCPSDETYVGDGFILWIADDYNTRFPGNSRLPLTTDHLIPVRYVDGVWSWHDNTTWNTFTPIASDILLYDCTYAVDGRQSSSPISPLPNVASSSVTGTGAVVVDSDSLTTYSGSWLSALGLLVSHGEATVGVTADCTSAALVLRIGSATLPAGSELAGTGHVTALSGTTLVVYTTTTSTGVVVSAANASVPAVSSLTGAGYVTSSRTGNVPAVSSMTSAGYRIASATAAWQAVSSQIAAGLIATSGSGACTASSSQVTLATVTKFAVASIAAVASQASSAQLTVLGDSTVNSATSLASSGIVVSSASATAEATSAVASSGVVTSSRTASISASTSTANSAYVVSSRAATLGATCLLESTADVTTSTGAGIAVETSLASSASLTAMATADITSLAEVASAGTLATFSDGSLASVSSVASTGQLVGRGDASFGATSFLASMGVVVSVRSASVPVSSAVIATGFVASSSTAAVTTTSSASASAVLIVSGSATSTAAADLASGGSVLASGDSAAFASVSQVTATGLLVAGGTATATASSGLAATGVATSFGSVAMQAESALAASAGAGQVDASSQVESTTTCVATGVYVATASSEMQTTSSANTLGVVSSSSDAQPAAYSQVSVSGDVVVSSSGTITAFSTLGGWLRSAKVGCRIPGERRVVDVDPELRNRRVPIEVRQHKT